MALRDSSISLKRRARDVESERRVFGFNVHCPDGDIDASKMPVIRCCDRDFFLFDPAAVYSRKPKINCKHRRPWRARLPPPKKARWKGCSSRRRKRARRLRSRWSATRKAVTAFPLRNWTQGITTSRSARWGMTWMGHQVLTSLAEARHCRFETPQDGESFQATHQRGMDRKRSRHARAEKFSRRLRDLPHADSGRFSLRTMPTNS